ncbi:MAG TPA: hypothetical protein VFC19_27985 [Candidatus Limnocylindrales bacterium]|nr:hypothetical protein [Candidatus Limnocylindrales bacterium]
MTVASGGRSLGLFFLAGGSIAALLADVFGVAPMHLVFWLASVPSMVALALLGSLSKVGGEWSDRIRVGALGGLAGTLGYDLVRVPFAIAGQRVFAPIESYGILIADACASSPLTSTLGWMYHFSNGVTFGIAYAAIAARRHWAWGVLWGLLLESVALFSPFGVRYNIAGQAGPIAIAYGAHLAYGYPLGKIVQDFDAVRSRLARFTVAIVLTLSIIILLGWLRPWDGPAAPGPVAVVARDRFEPEWLRIRAGECVTIENRSGTRFETAQGELAATGSSRLCFARAGVYRVKLGPRPYSGGFVYVNDH